ncbi:D-3-phosphoglycerate dehydrogenase [Halobacillus karajensis]|uniref:C-terminal binding protein n=1 Tax=Halobacillus karajensis TaxID=195088 RepID=UPI0008A76F2F|nr:C-terminal binding protein [Halobacillus karajensis]SEI02195.1 D-3-phosphoglycerate dehydrogenase [Halobacillus karajensis]
MSKFKVLIADYTYSTLEPEKKVLETAGAEVITAQCRTEEDVIEAAHGVDGIICQYAPISKKVIDQLATCKIVARYGVGFDTIDVPAATEKGIMVTNVTDYSLDEVSNHAFALLMACARKVVQLNESVQNGRWDSKVAKPIYRLHGQTLGLIGFGNIPQRLALKAKAFGLEILAYDPFVSNDLAKELGVKLVDLQQLCALSDYISVHPPLNKHTKGMVSDEQFRAMKESAYIINTSRGAVIDEPALIRALEANEIAGAGLDVLETEPMAKDNPLLSMPNVIITPHSAYYSVESELELKQKTAQNVADALSGKEPAYLVNKDVVHA